MSIKTRKFGVHVEELFNAFRKDRWDLPKFLNGQVEFPFTAFQKFGDVVVVAHCEFDNTSHFASVMFSWDGDKATNGQTKEVVRRLEQRYG